MKAPRQEYAQGGNLQAKGSRHLLAAPVVELRPYKAFGEFAAHRRGDWLELRWCSGAASVLRYRDLQEAGYARRGPELVMLQFHLGRVLTLRGRNLKPVLQAILLARCEWIAEAGTDIPAPGVPVVETIYRHPRTVLLA